MAISDWLGLLHPAIAVFFVFPLIGMVVNFAWQTRQRRLQTVTEGKSKIPPVVGRDHVNMGRWLTGAVVGIALLGLAYAIFEHIISDQIWSKNPAQAIFIVLMFATLTGTGLVVLGCQDGVFRRTDEWYWSHYYIGIAAALLMVFSLAIVEDIYKDRSNRWRYVHVILNCVALLLFMGQGITGTRDLLEIPLSWQKPFVYQCDFVNKTCPQPAPPSKS